MSVIADDTGPFPASALEANKYGSLTDGQKRLIRSLSRGVRKSELSVAVFSAAFGIFIIFAVKPNAAFWFRVGVPVACVALAVFLIARAITGGDRLTRDLRNPRVESLEGPISKHVVTSHSRGTSGSSTSSRTYYLRVAGQEFRVGPVAYQAAPEAGFVRIYFLSISRHVVNLEQLPDRPLPPGTTPQSLIHDLKGAVLSFDRAQLDEIRAEAAGTAHQFQASISHDVNPPPAQSRDARPLAEAIQGTWSNGPLTVTFSASGSFEITILGANQRSGHWSVDPNGKLVADLGGRDQSTEAWIVGDQLTVSLGDSTITLSRKPA